MSASAAHPFLEAASAGGKGKKKLPVLPVQALLQAQRTMTAVERFASRHGAGEVPRQARYYRDLIPLERPGAGQQYGFEVDLDACTGCKACVAACHTLNGLDTGEVWRTVGLLHGGTPSSPALQTVTTSCHHCLEPACMAGCPVKAYEKDPVTGIVKHLDDQCFGCQYCTLMCPYDAPKFNKARGIVRKCDMCSDRLAHGEAPACVQACPNEAIAIRVVEQTAAVQASDAGAFLPGAPAPEHTLPTTVYRTQKPMPSNMLPADFYSTSPEHSHPPLVVMLVLTQLSVGAFTLSLVAEALSGRSAGSARWQAVFAVVLALVALGASVLHLGRPHLFFRAVLGLRTSWLSREALAFGIFAKLAVLYAGIVAVSALPGLPLGSVVTAAEAPVRVSAALAGAAGVFCSVMVYVATRRQHWSAARTGLKFLGTTLSLGAALVLAVQVFTTALPALDITGRALLALVIATSVVKLASEAALLQRRKDKQRSVEKRVAHVLLNDLRRSTALRFALGFAGGILIPSVWLLAAPGSAPAGLCSMFVLGALLSGETLERYQFFRAAPASRMPGALP